MQTLACKFPRNSMNFQISHIQRLSNVMSFLLVRRLKNISSFIATWRNLMKHATNYYSADNVNMSKYHQRIQVPQFGSTVPYAVLGVSFPLHKPYPYSLYR